jgi:hypothetical protein
VARQFSSNDFNNKHKKMIATIKKMAQPLQMLELMLEFWRYFDFKFDTNHKI